MPVTLALQNDDGDFTQDPDVILWEELLDYLATLHRYPAICSLGHADPYGEATLDPLVCRQLLRELRVLRLANRQIPMPPAKVGLEWSDEGETFGWDGIVDFTEAVERLLKTAAQTGKRVVVVGD